MKQPPVIDNMELWTEKQSLLELWLRMGFEELGPELKDNPLEGLEKLQIPTSLAACSAKISDKSSVDTATKRGQALAKTHAPKGKLAQEVWPAYYGAIVLYTGENYHLQSRVIHCPSVEFTNDWNFTFQCLWHCLQCIECLSAHHVMSQANLSTKSWTSHCARSIVKYHSTFLTSDWCSKRWAKYRPKRSNFTVELEPIYLRNTKSARSSLGGVSAAAPQIKASLKHSPRVWGLAALSWLWNVRTLSKSQSSLCMPQRRRVCWLLALSSKSSHGPVWAEWLTFMSKKSVALDSKDERFQGWVILHSKLCTALDASNHPI